MADSPTTINYEVLMQNAIRHLIKELLMHVSKNGLPGDHYFYIEFLTHFPGVQLSESLKSEYPDEMLVALQYEFDDLEVNEDSFSVTLVFDEEERITIPFMSIVRFSDPSVDFAAEFEPDINRYESEKIKEILNELECEEKVTPADTDASNIIQFDFFKKK